MDQSAEAMSTEGRCESHVLLDSRATAYVAFLSSLDVAMNAECPEEAAAENKRHNALI